LLGGVKSEKRKRRKRRFEMTKRTIESKLREVSRKMVALKSDPEINLIDLNAGLEALRAERRALTTVKVMRPSATETYQKLRSISRRYGWLRRNADLAVDADLEFASLRAERAVFNAWAKVAA
jgi:hypothetical protein